MDLPLILAGPILRRVEPTLVSVWLATKEPCTISISLWEGRGKKDSLTSWFSDPNQVTDTIRIGEKLHIAVVTLKLSLGNVLLPGRIYSYDVTLSSQSETQELKSAKLLEEGMLNGKPNLPLGYETDFLPSFAMPPMELTDLRVLHGSCRRSNKEAPDGLAWADDFIKMSLDDPLARPHQLFLTGDQIYADDVAIPMLQMLNEFSKTLIGSRLDASEERIPVEEIKVADKLWSVNNINFPEGFRLSLTQNEARFTSIDGYSHLLSLGEFCAMYLFSWSNACWPDQLPAEDDFLPSFSWLGLIPGNLRLHIIGPYEKEQLLTFYRLGEISSTNMQNTLGPGEDLPPLFSEEDKEDKLKELKLAFKKELLKLKTLKTALPKVRRALANIPTYMMFDDHEVTDDWYLNPMWRDRVLTSPLGKTIIRNGLLAYALFQGWGNDPVKFETDVYKELLKLATGLFPPGETPGPNEIAGDKIDKLLGLDGKDPPVKWHYSVLGARHMVLAFDNRTRRSFVSRVGPPGNISAEAMEEQIPSSPMPSGIDVLVVLAPLPVLGPPVMDELLAPLIYRVFDLKAYMTGKLDTEGHKNMPGTNPDAIEAWALDAKTFELLLKRLEPYRRVVFLSGDVHYGASQAMSYWKKDDTEPARFAQFTSSGMRNTMPPYVKLVDRSFAFAQRIIRANIGTERLGWNENSPKPLLIPPDVEAEIVPALRSKLKQIPVMVPTHGWPEGTTVNPAHLPDWSWRVRVVRDKRPDKDRPVPAQPEDLHPGEPDADIEANIDGYRRVAVRHAKQLEKLNNSRQILFANNLGLVKFENRDDILHVVHELYTVHPAAEIPEKPELYTLHVVALHNPLEDRPEKKMMPEVGDE
jgi:hypothetical protein